MARNTGARFLTRTMEREGVRVVFGYPGGAIMPVYDALYDSSLVHVLVRHEQAAALAADGYARASGEVGVCIATSGPGATNLVTGLANAFLDSVPLVAITGQVPTPFMGTDAFQEVDIFGITFPVVKHSFLVRRAEDLPEMLSEAFHIARSGRPGPVLVDLPKDIAAGDCAAELREPKRVARLPVPHEAELTKAAEILATAKRPVIYAGGGVGMGGAVDVFRRVVDDLRIPVVTTLKGLGAIPTSHPLFLGMLGMHGTRAANEAVQGSDVLLCIGARFDDRATGKLATFAPNARVIHMDGDRAEVGKLRSVQAAVVGDLTAGLHALSAAVPSIEAWRAQCLAQKREYAWSYDPPTDGVYGPRFLKRLTEVAAERKQRTIVSCDVGQHQMWVAQHCHFERPERHLTSGGLGTMGYGLPAAIGAQYARPDATVINVTGDGSVMMNLQELATIRRYQLPVKLVLLDNQALGLVRQWQELFFDGRYSEVDLSDNPDFGRVAEAFGIPSLRIDRGDEEEAAIDRLLSEPGPMLAHVAIDREANVWPLVPPNRSNAEMMVGAHR